jgi:nicotinamide-nucleotide amidase
MKKASLITIGTEITCGEVLNTNASWVSLQLEQVGIRVFTHLTVRDERSEVLAALNFCREPLVIVTGGLGPTSDDLTRECMAQHAGLALEFDQAVWTQMQALYLERGLPLREAHKHQCHFPSGSKPLKNPVGSALGFQMTKDKQTYFVLPGPPSELQAMWQKEVAKQLEPYRDQSKQWVRWTCIGAPESEIAELVEPIVKGQDIELGYRAQVPYVKVKVFVDPVQQAQVVHQVDRVLAPFTVARGDRDMAQELMRLWPDATLHLEDEVTGAQLARRLLGADHHEAMAISVGSQAARSIEALPGESRPIATPGIRVTASGESFTTEFFCRQGHFSETRTLPYRTKLTSERGKRSACEWAICFAVQTLAQN